MTTSGAPFTVMKCGVLEDPAGQPVRAVVERRHELVLGVERHLRAPRQRAAGLLGVDAHLRGEHDQGRLGRVADDRLVVATVASLHSVRPSARRLKSGSSAPATPRIAPGLAVAPALDVIPVAAGEHRGRGHRVQRQRPGLVAVDHGRPAQASRRRSATSRPPWTRPGAARPTTASPARTSAVRSGSRRWRSRCTAAGQRVDVLAPGDAEHRDDRHGQPRDRCRTPWSSRPALCCSGDFVPLASR